MLQYKTEVKKKRIPANIILFFISEMRFPLAGLSFQHSVQAKGEQNVNLRRALHWLCSCPQHWCLTAARKLSLNVSISLYLHNNKLISLSPYLFLKFKMSIFTFLTKSFGNWVTDYKTILIINEIRNVGIEVDILPTLSLLSLPLDIWIFSNIQLFGLWSLCLDTSKNTEVILFLFRKILMV